MKNLIHRRLFLWALSPVLWRRRSRDVRFVLALLAWFPAAAVEATVVPLPGHPEQPVSTNFSLTVGGQPVQVKAERFGFDVALFSLSSEPVSVEVTLPNAFTAYTLDPARYNLATTRTSNSIRFTLSQPLNLVLQVDALPPLALLATPLETRVPRPGDTNVIYFGPGTNVAGLIQPANNQTIYLAPGALVRGRILAQNVTNVAVRGRGFLETQGYSDRAAQTAGILFSNASNVSVEGIGVRSFRTWWQTLFINSQEIAVSHVNVFGVGVNTDGVDIDGVENFTVSDSFIRSEDDALGWHALDAVANGQIIVENATATNLVIWNTGAGNGMRMVGASMEDTLWRNITLADIDILKHAGSGICSDHADWAWVEDLRFQNIRISRGVSPINIKIAKNRYSNSNGFLDERGHFNRLTFDNVQMNGGRITLNGYDSTHLIDNVCFNNCTNQGLPVNDLSNLTLNAYVANVQFNQPLPPRPPAVDGVSEAEYTDTVTDRVPQYIFGDTNLSNGEGKIIKMAGPGHYALFPLKVSLPGAYDVRVKVMKGPDGGTFQLSYQGTNCGAAQDLYAPSAQYQLLNFGRVTFPAAGTQPLKFTSVTRNSASVGDVFKGDYFQLEPFPNGPVLQWKGGRSQRAGTNQGVGTQ